jgi:hypothetical protein
MEGLLSGGVVLFDLADDFVAAFLAGRAERELVPDEGGDCGDCAERRHDVGEEEVNHLEVHLA